MAPVGDETFKEALNEIYMSSDVASTILDDFGARANNVRVTKVAALEARLRRTGHKIPRREIVPVLKQLAEAGCGRFVLGRGEQPTRLKWSVSSISVGKVASGEEIEVDWFDEGQLSIEEMLDDDSDADSLVEMLQHSYRIRPDLEIKLALPEDLTSVEASRLAEFVRTLPFTQ